MWQVVRDVNAAILYFEYICTSLFVVFMRLTSIFTKPFSVNLIALLIRLFNIWLSRAGSPVTCFGSVGFVWFSSIFFLRLYPDARYTLSNSCKLKSMCWWWFSRLNFAEIQNIIYQRHQIVRRKLQRFQKFHLIFARFPCSNKYDIPITAFIGVRISWLAVDKNSIWYLRFSADSHTAIRSYSTVLPGNVFC